MKAYFTFNTTKIFTAVDIRALWIKTVSTANQAVASTHNPVTSYNDPCVFNPFEPEFTIVFFIRYKPRIAVAIPHL